VGKEIFHTRPERSWALLNLLYNGYQVFPGAEVAESGVNHPPDLAPRLKKEQSYISAPSLDLRGLF
jgi:hypothetical protein